MADDGARPRVTAIVPCYNDGATLPETVASLRENECEIVVVDDGSDEQATIEVLERLRAEGVRVLHVAHGGVAAARMAGVRASTTPYVFPLDADDLVAPGALAALADTLDADPGVAVAWGHIETFGSGHGVVKMAPELDPWLITYMNPLPVMSMIRRDALLSVGGWRSGVHYEDWDVWMSLAERGWKGVRIPRTTAYYRVHGIRRWALGRRRYDEIVERLRRDHEALFAARSANRRTSSAAPHVKLLFPLIDRLPVSLTWKRRVHDLVRQPYFTVSSALRRRLTSARR